MKKLLIVLALVLIVPGLLMTTACSTSKKKAGSDAGLTQPVGGKDTRTTTSSDKTRSGMDNSGVSGTGYVGQDAFINQDVYFAYDSSALDAQAQGVLKSKADFLRSNSNAAVTIEGHCDERGTSEYNMALGQKRADSVKKFLINLGVSASRMNTVSFGKERPVEQGHNEAAWSKNRRAHFVLAQ